MNDGFLAIIVFSIILIIFLGIITFITIINSKLERYKQISDAYKMLMTINSKYYFSYFKKGYIFKEKCNSRQKFNNYNYDSFVEKLIKDNYGEYSRRFERCSKNKKNYYLYISEVNSINVEEDCKKNNLSPFLLKLLLKKNIYKQPTFEFFIHIFISYSSPTGRVNVSANNKINYSTLYLIYNRIKALREIDEITKNKKENAHKQKEKLEKLKQESAEELVKFKAEQKIRKLEAQEQEERERAKRREEERIRKQVLKEKEYDYLLETKKSDLIQNNIKKQRELTIRENQLRKREEELLRREKEFEEATKGHKYSINIDVPSINDTKFNELNNPQISYEEKLTILKELYDNSQISYEDYINSLKEVL